MNKNLLYFRYLIRRLIELRKKKIYREENAVISDKQKKREEKISLEAIVDLRGLYRRVIFQHAEYVSRAKGGAQRLIKAKDRNRVIVPWKHWQSASNSRPTITNCKRDFHYIISHGACSKYLSIYLLLLGCKRARNQFFPIQDSERKFNFIQRTIRNEIEFRNRID